MFETIVNHVPAPDADPDGPFNMLATLLDRDNFVGRVLTGRIASGKLMLNMPIKALDDEGNVVEEGRATKIMAFRGLERVPVEEAEAGRHRRHRRADQSDRLQLDRRSRRSPSRCTPSRSTRRPWR